MWRLVSAAERSGNVRWRECQRLVVNQHQLQTLLTQSTRNKSITKHPSQMQQILSCTIHQVCLFVILKNLFLKASHRDSLMEYFSCCRTFSTWR